MNLINKEMYVLRKKGTTQYMRNNGYFESIEGNGKSAIKLYDNLALCKSAVRLYNEDNYEFVKVCVSISEVKEQTEI